MSGAQLAGGWAGAVLALVANAYYIVLIRQGRATPHPVTWLVWALIGALGAVSAIESGAGPGSLVPVAYASTYAVTSFYALRRFRSGRPDAGTSVTRYDLALGLTAAVLAVGWKVADLGPGWLAALAVGADTLALLPTLRYAWTEPSTGGERGVWTADTVAAVLGLTAVTLPWTAAAVAYPGYLVIGNACVTAAMYWRRRGVARVTDPAGVPEPGHRTITGS